MLEPTKPISRLGGKRCLAMKTTRFPMPMKNGSLVCTKAIAIECCAICPIILRGERNDMMLSSVSEKRMEAIVGSTPAGSQSVVSTGGHHAWPDPIRTLPSANGWKGFKRPKNKCWSWWRRKKPFTWCWGLSAGLSRIWRLPCSVLSCWLMTMGCICP